MHKATVVKPLARKHSFFSLGVFRLITTIIIISTLISMVPLLSSMVGLNSLSYEKFSAGNKEGKEGKALLDLPPEPKYDFPKVRKYYFSEDGT